MHPIVTDPTFNYVGSGCPNKWTLQESKQGQAIGHQTNNLSGVTNPDELDSTLQNAWDNSDAMFVEIYEERLWNEAGERVEKSFNELHQAIGFHFL